MVAGGSRRAQRPLLAQFRFSRLAGNGSKGEGFWTPALCDGGGEAPGAGVQKPPKEENAGRKGSGGRDLWGFAGRGRSAGVGPEASGRRLRRSEGRWRACSIVQMRGLTASRGAIGEGFRTPALCGRWGGRGAGVRKPPKEETAGRKGPFGGRDLWGFEGRGGSARGGPGPAGRVFASTEATTASLFDREDARPGASAAGRGSAELVRTSPSCSGARLEAKAIGVARREARRWS